MVLNFFAQYKLSILQRFVVEQPVQLCPLRRSIAVLVLDGGAVDGNGGAILEPGFHPVGVHVIVAGKQFHHNSSILLDLILVYGHSNQCRQAGGG